MWKNCESSDARQICVPRRLVCAHPLSTGPTLPSRLKSEWLWSQTKRTRRSHWQPNSFKPPRTRYSNVAPQCVLVLPDPYPFVCFCSFVRLFVRSRFEFIYVSVETPYLCCWCFQVLDAIVMIEDSMAKLQEYADELLKVAAKHFPEVTRRLPKLERREMGKVESLKDVNQKKVRFGHRPLHDCQHFTPRSC